MMHEIYNEITNGRVEFKECASKGESSEFIEFVRFMVATVEKQVHTPYPL